jgi:hypothetical protein
MIFFCIEKMRTNDERSPCNLKKAQYKVHIKDIIKQQKRGIEIDINRTVMT